MRKIVSRALGRRPSVVELVHRLAEERKRTTRLPRASATAAPRIVRDRTNWVRCRVDYGQCVDRAADGAIARRAITDEGRLIWLVHAPGRRHAYHAVAAGVEAAFAEADAARVRRRAIGRRWAEIARLRRDVLLCRRRFFTTVGDAREAGLCELGIRGFLARFGLARRGGAPAFVLALVSFVDRQPGYAMFAAHLRLEREAARPRSARG